MVFVITDWARVVVVKKRLPDMAAAFSSWHHTVSKVLLGSKRALPCWNSACVHSASTWLVHRKQDFLSYLFVSIRVYNFVNQQTLNTTIFKSCLFVALRDDSCLFVSRFCFVLKNKNTTRVYFVSIVRWFVSIRVYVFTVPKICLWHNEKHMVSEHNYRPSNENRHPSFSNGFGHQL